ncbi:MAG: aminoacetone oxidase family FAD-binding enzyme [Clostridia bacterium]|nr:aminoacetone oxidase family FAD-binding enzyme [Clostridia bacterium]
MNFDVAIIGGGAAGLACASRLSERTKNLKIAVIEAGERAGKKLAATGNGQGNVTNANMSAEHYFGGNVPLVEKLACGKDNFLTESSLFKCVLSRDEQGRVYPGGRQASALVDSLLADLKRSGVTLITGVKVEKLSRGFVLFLSDGRNIEANYVVLCTGGKAQKQYKTDGSAYSLATNLGHTLTPLYPSLVQLKTDTQHIKTLKGIRTDCIVSAFSGGKKIAEKRGDVIFTEYGVSGNAIFAISPYVADKQSVTLSLHFLPQSSAFIAEDVLRKKKLGYPDSELLSGTLHNQLGRAIIKRVGSCDERAIENMVCNFTLPVTGSLGFDYAQVTKGGINMSEVSDNLESKLVKNLFFAGEILDVDGECGGYNLHWVFSSACAVADEISKRV